MIEILALSRTLTARLIRYLKPALGLGQGTQLDLFGPNPAWQAQLSPILALLDALITDDQAMSEAWRAVQQLDRVQLTRWRAVAKELAIPPARGVLEQVVLEERARELASYIRDIPTKLQADVAAQVLAARDQGMTTVDLGKLIAERTGIAQRRAALIARDQLGTLNGELSQRRQVAAGVSRYRWQTARDERVRPSHRDLQGQVFSWDAPPDIGHPGAPINCRCIAIPIIDD